MKKFALSADEGDASVKRSLVLLLAFALVIAGCRSGQKAPVVTSGSADVGDAKIHYDEAGKGGALVLIHGGFLTKEMWDGHFERYARKYRVVRYDARNHGLSRSEKARYAHFEDLKKLLDHLKIDKAVIMGLSLGGYVAIDFALKYPERVNGLILVAPGLGGYEFNDPETQAYQKKFNEAVGAGDVERMIDAFMEAWVYGPHRKAEDVDAALRDKIRAMARRTLATWNPETQELVASPLAVGRLGEIKVPTLVLVGDIDMPSILDIVGLIEKNVPHVHKIVIPGVAHMVNLEKPKEFDRAVEAFLKKVY